MTSIDRAAAASAGDDRAAHRALPVIVALVVFLTLLLSGSRLLGDGDTYWHIVSGRWIIAHHAVPHQDIFSFSMAGAPWVPHEWLAEVLFAWLYDTFGWAGPVAVAPLALALALGLLAHFLLRFLAPTHAIIGVATAWAMALPHLLARPHALSLPLFVLWVGTLICARAAARAPPLWLALVMLLWANLHGSFMLGLVLAGMLAGEAVVSAASLRQAFVAARGWGLFLLLAVAVVLLTPSGIDTLLLPIKLLRMPFALSIIGEWRPVDFQHLTQLELWLMLALFLVMVLRPVLPWTRALMLLALLHMALSHQRNDDVLGLATPLLVAVPVAAALRGTGASALDGWLARLAFLARPVGFGLVAAAIAALTVFVLPRGLARGLDDHTPAAALAAVRAAHVEGPVLNDYSFGGYLIFAGVPVFIDGRTDMYGDAFVRRWYEATSLGSAELPDLLAHYHITWTLLDRRSAATILLDHLPGWRRLYEDDIAVVHVREPQQPL